MIPELVYLDNYEHKKSWYKSVLRLNKDDIIVYMDYTISENNKKSLQFFCGYYVGETKYVSLCYIKPILHINKNKLLGTKLVKLVKELNGLNIRHMPTFLTNIETVCSINYKRLESFVGYWENI